MRKPSVLIMLVAMVSCSQAKKPAESRVSLAEYRVQHLRHLTEDPRSPIAESDLPDIDFFPENKEWDIKCSCRLLENEKPFELPTYSGITRTYIRFARADCKNKVGKFSLTIYRNLSQPNNPIYKDHLFLPFKDHTNGEETYGGGRYIDLKQSSIKGNSIRIDFNKCYNPWCAYSDGYNCPVPPRDNHLELSVPAGEKNFRGDHKKGNPKQPK
jgi:uncharacterized protein (DUF1684 family)